MQNPREQFEIPGIVRFEKGQGGLTRIVVTSPFAAAEIYLHGAHVTNYTPAGQQPVLWMSKASMFEPGKPIRGGVPICFPWFGPRAGDPKAPGHGFVRLREWNVESVKQAPDGAVVIALSLRADDATKAWWPVDFTIRYTVSVSRSLQMTLEVLNDSKEPITFDEALHTYFNVGDIKQVVVEGMGTGAQYIDKVGGVNNREQVDPAIHFTGETDRVYTDTTATCVINDPSMKRKIEVSKSGSDATVVWNPWVAKSKAMPDFGDEEWTGMVCVESVNAAKHAVKLAPGAKHSMTQRVRVL